MGEEGQGRHRKQICQFLNFNSDFLSLLTFKVLVNPSINLHIQQMFNECLSYKTLDRCLYNKEMNQKYNIPHSNKQGHRSGLGSNKGEL